MAKKAAYLEDRGVITVGGEDAATFLQGLLTNDVERLAAGEARYAGLLSPQGKILFDMLVVRAPPHAGAAFLIDCAAGRTADLARRLGFYKLRARVAVDNLTGSLGVLALWGGKPTMPPDLAFADPRHAESTRRAGPLRPGGGAGRGCLAAGPGRLCGGPRPCRVVGRPAGAWQRRRAAGVPRTLQCLSAPSPRTRNGPMRATAHSIGGSSRSPRALSARSPA